MRGGRHTSGLFCNESITDCEKRTGLSLRVKVLARSREVDEPLGG